MIIKISREEISIKLMAVFVYIFAPLKVKKPFGKVNNLHADVADHEDTTAHKKRLDNS